MKYIRKIKALFFVFTVLFPALVSGQIIFTDVNPDSLVSGQYALDLNNDGTPEFRIEHVLEGGIDIVQAAGISSQDSIDGFYAGFPQVVGYLHALSSDEIIGSTSNLIEEGVMGGDHALIMEDAEWPDAGSRYLGLKFNISGEAHYGWAKIKISTDYVGFTVMEYAYNATAGEPINSGIAAVHENASSIAELSVFPNPCTETATLRFSLRDETALAISIYDLSGKLVFAEAKGKTRPGTQVVQLNVTEWSEGIYFCRINSETNSTTYKLSVIR